MADSWAIKASFPIAGYSATNAGTLDGDKLHFVGGFVRGQGVADQHWRYDPNTNSWSSRAPYPRPTEAGTSAVVNNLLHVIGGSNKHDVYNSVTNTWSSRADAPEGYIANVWGMGVADVKGHIIRSIHIRGTQPGGHVTYDANLDVWSVLPQAPYPVSYAAGGYIEGLFHVVTGISSTGMRHFVYNESMDTWTDKPHPPITPLNDFARGVIKRKIFVVGGGGQAQGYHRTNNEYDDTTGTWAQRAPMPTARYRAASGVSRNRLYVVAGAVRYSFWGTTEYTRANEEYTPLGIGGYVYRYTGSSWQQEDVMVRQGSSWTPAEVHVYRNGQWQLSE